MTTVHVDIEKKAAIPGGGGQKMRSRRPFPYHTPETELRE